MSGRSFFSSKAWERKVIDFLEVDHVNNITLTGKWQIKQKVDEHHELGDQDEWEYFSRTRPMMAVALFHCFNFSDPTEEGFMKVYMQIPYEGSEPDPASDRAAQKLPDAKINEETALVTLTAAGCKSSPPLLSHKRATQEDTSSYVPGGFLVYLVTERLPGEILKLDEYWAHQDNERTKIRLAFKDAWKDCLECGIVHTFGFLGANLLWDATSERIFILGFSRSRGATEDDAWDDSLWITWKFCRPVKGVKSVSHARKHDILAFSA